MSILGLFSRPEPPPRREAAPVPDADPVSTRGRVVKPRVEQIGWSPHYCQVYLVTKPNGCAVMAFVDETMARAWMALYEVIDQGYKVNPIRCNGLSDPPAFDFKMLKVSVLMDDREQPVQLFTSYKEAKSVASNNADKGWTRGPLILDGRSASQ
jgi:hypothetical protein